MKQSRVFIIVVLGFLGLASCGVTPNQARQDAEQDAFAARVLAKVQRRSIRENVEYCGAIGVDALGALVATPPVKGGPDWCEFTFPETFFVTASYHTHAGYNPDAWSELPSDDDVLDDARNGVDGYISTPGGRLWFVDGSSRTVRQVCGVGCLPSDPDWQPETDTDVQTRYTLRGLQAVFGG